MTLHAPESVMPDQDAQIILDAPIPTWFGIGGRADRFCTPPTVAGLQRCVAIDPALRVLGDGANLLVDDAGVGELVVSLKSPAFTSTQIDAATGRVTAGAGADLPRLILATGRVGLAGLDGLGGIPATVGGAVIMNAGGAFGQIADSVVRVHALDRAGREVVRERADIAFSYRHSGLTDLIITRVELQLTPGDPVKVREHLKEVMAYKKGSQPMADRSAGCVFKNPTLPHDLKAVRPTAAGGETVEFARGSRASAGMLIDLAGCKGVRVGGASVSPRHANFIVTNAEATARDVIGLMREVTNRVHERFGVVLEPEVVVWTRTDQ